MSDHLSKPNADVEDLLESDRVIPTAVFLADPRAAVHLLQDTVESLCSTYALQRALVDLTTLPGLAVATALLRAGIPFEHIDFGQETPAQLPEDAVARDRRFKPNRARTMKDLPHLLAKSTGVWRVDVANLASVDANLVLIPAMVGTGQASSTSAEPLIDFSPTTIVGAVLDQAEKLSRDLLVIAPPERGLRAVAPASSGTASAERYERQTILVRASKDS